MFAVLTLEIKVSPAIKPLFSSDSVASGCRLAEDKVPTLVVFPEETKAYLSIFVVNPVPPVTYPYIGAEIPWAPCK